MWAAFSPTPSRKPDFRLYKKIIPRKYRRHLRQLALLSPLEPLSSRIDLADATADVDSPKIRRNIEGRRAAALQGAAEHYGRRTEERRLSPVPSPVWILMGRSQAWGLRNRWFAGFEPSVLRRDRAVAGQDFDAAIASVGTQEPMVRRLFPGGKWIRTIGPPPEIVVDPSGCAEIIGRITDVFRRDREFDVSALQGRISTV
jgi:hypothetical protein